LAVIVGSVAVRLVGIGWGLPYLYHPDEPNDLTRALTMLRESDLNPHWFHYGSLMFYLYGGLMAIVAGVRGLLGVGDGLGAIEGPQMIATASGITSDPWALLVPRAMSVAMSVATVVVIFFIVRRLTGRTYAAGFGAGLFALAPLAVSEGRLFTPNTLTALFTALAIGAAFRIYERGLPRDYVIAGAMVGLAAGSKYNAGFVFIAIVTAHLLRSRQSGAIHARGILMSIYTALAAFLITTPFAVLDADEFLGDLGFELVHYSTGHDGRDGGLLVYLSVLLVSFSLALVFIAFAYADRRLRPQVMISLVFGVGYVLFLSLFRTTFARNLLTALPAFCVVIALGASAAVDRHPRRLLRWWIPAVSLASLAVAGAGFWVEYSNLEDRTEAVEWIAQNVPQHSLVLVEAYSPWVDPSTHEVVNLGFVIDGTPRTDWDYMLVTPEGSGRFEGGSDRYATEIAALEEIRSTTCLIEEFPGVVEIRRQDCQ
jgi:4-amino-4-deoxy-L-arabinose transferase-like glycosyltransferase